MSKENISRVLCFAGGAVVATAACARYFARRDRELGRVKGNDLEILLDRACISYPSALHAIISNAQKFGGGTNTVQLQEKISYSLLTKIVDAQEVWKELVSCSSDSSEFFSAISQAREIGLDAQPFIQQWMESTRDADTVRDALDRKLPEKAGIDVGILEEHWRNLVMESSSPWVLLSAIRRVAAAGDHDWRLLHAWKLSILECRSSERVYDVLKERIPESLQVDAEPLKDHWITLILRSHDCSEVFRAIQLSTTIGVDERSLKTRWIELALELDTRIGIYKAIREAVAIGVDHQFLKDRWAELFFREVEGAGLIPGLITSFAQLVNNFSEFVEEFGIDDMAKERLITRIVIHCQRTDVPRHYRKAMSGELAEAMPILCKSCATHTGKLVMAEAFATDDGLEISCQLLSGTNVLKASLPADGTIATLEDTIKQAIGWESARCVDALTNCTVSGHHALSECSGLVIQELGLPNHGLKKLWTSLIQLRMDTAGSTELVSRQYEDELTTLLVDRSHLRNKVIDIVRFESLRDWISSAISSMTTIADLKQFSDLVADVLCWASALATQIEAQEARTQAKRSFVLKPSIGTWMMPIEMSFTKKQRQFTITLRKTPLNSRLGLSVDISNATHIVVENVNGGLMEEWNQHHPLWMVLPGDRVMAVNGQSGDAVELTQVCKQDDVLEMLIVRC